MPSCCTTLPVRGNVCEPMRYDCEPTCNTVGSGAINVGLAHALESMIVGRDEHSMASRLLN